VFRGGFDLDAAAAVAGGKESDVLDLVASLVDSSLLQREARQNDPVVIAPRYRMLETVREFGLELLTSNEGPENAHDAHAQHFLAVAEQAIPEWWGPEPGTWLDRLETERDNLRGALDWAVEQEDATVSCRLATALAWFWRVRGPVREGVAWMNRVGLLSAGIEADLRAQFLIHAGDLAAVGGDTSMAASLLDEAIALARELGDPQVLIPALAFGGYAAVLRGDDNQAEPLLDEAIRLARAMSDPVRLAGALGVLAGVAWRAGEYARATNLLDEASTICRATRQAYHGANINSFRAAVLAEQGEFAHAQELYQASLTAMWMMGERRDFAGALAGYAWMAAAQGNPGYTARLCGATDALIEAVGATLPPFGQANYERALVMARAGLDAGAFEGAWTAGRALQPEQILTELTRALPSAGDTAHAPERIRSQFGLTGRELEVLRELPSSTYREIARRLFVSERTVEHHVHSICAKFGVNHRRAAVEFARRNGLL
jgi:non-specific serine/threonine protein kinase